MNRPLIKEDLPRPPSFTSLPAPSAPPASAPGEVRMWINKSGSTGSMEIASAPVEDPAWVAGFGGLWDLNQEDSKGTYLEKGLPTLKDQQQRRCDLCWRMGKDSNNGNDIIKPCRCKGYYVHRRCLSEMRQNESKNFQSRGAYNPNGGDGGGLCSHCGFQYLVHPNPPEVPAKIYARFYGRVVATICVFLFVMNCVVMGTQLILYHFFPTGLNVFWLFNSSLEGKDSFFYYYSCALFFDITIAGFFMAIYEFCIKDENDRMCGGDCGSSSCNCNGVGGEAALIIGVIALILFIIMGVFAGLLLFFASLGKVSKKYFEEVIEEKRLLECYILDIEHLEKHVLDPYLHPHIPVTALHPIVYGYLHG